MVSAQVHKGSDCTRVCDEYPSVVRCTNRLGFPLSPRNTTAGTPSVPSPHLFNVLRKPFEIRKQVHCYPVPGARCMPRNRNDTFAARACVYDTCPPSHSPTNSDETNRNQIMPNKTKQNEAKKKKSKKPLRITYPAAAVSFHPQKPNKIDGSEGES